MRSVFILWHIHEFGGESDEKLIGVYETQDDAESAIARLSEKPGFKDTSHGFEICEYELGKDHWIEGYFTAQPLQMDLPE